MYVYWSSKCTSDASKSLAGDRALNKSSFYLLILLLAQCRILWDCLSTFSSEYLLLMTQLHHQDGVLLTSSSQEHRSLFLICTSIIENLDIPSWTLGLRDYCPASWLPINGPPLYIVIATSSFHCLRDSWFPTLEWIQCIYVLGSGSSEHLASKRNKKTFYSKVYPSFLPLFELSSVSVRCSWGKCHLCTPKWIITK